VRNVQKAGQVEAKRSSKVETKRDAKTLHLQFVLLGVTQTLIYHTLALLLLSTSGSFIYI